jgi:hypothetical protein
VIITWRVIGLDDLARLIVEGCGPDRPAVVAVNGHSSSGKTTLAGQLATRLPAAAVLHTDDVAWHQGVFAWDVLLRHDVLPRVRAGEPLDYRPPQWQARSRPGSIRLPGLLRFLVVEGVGASQEPVRDLLDSVIWVETDEPTRLARDLPRLAAGEMSPADYASWMAEENAYVTRERPWEHADLLVYGGDSIPHDPSAEVVIADPGR